MTGSKGWSLALAWFLVAAPSAEAARKPYAFINDAEMLAEGDVEFEQWVEVMRTIHEPSGVFLEHAWLWWGPVVALSNHLEASLPVEFYATKDHIYFNALEASLRYRLFPKEDVRALQPLFWLTYRQPFGQHLLGHYAPPGVDSGAVLTYAGTQALSFTANLGLRADLPFLVPAPERRHPTLLPVRALTQATWGAGASYAFLDGELKLAAEATGAVTLSARTAPDPVFAGGAVSWTRGRLWVTAGSVFGITPGAPPFMAKVLWGVAL